MKKIGLLMTDTHLSPSTIDINRSIWRQAVEVCKENDITTIYHLGDVFDSRKSQTQEMLLILDELLEMVSNSNIEITIIPGNHDKTDYESSDSFLKIYRHHPNVQIANYLSIHNTSKNLSIPVDTAVVLVPFFSEKSGKYTEVLKGNPSLLDKYKTKFLLTHIGVNDAVMNGGSVIQDHLEGDIFSDFDKVYVGHFHDYQELKKGKIVYIGSSYQANYGEDNKKGFQLLNQDGSIEYVKTSFPEYKKVSIDIDSCTKQDIQRLKKEYEGSEDNIRFVFQGSKEKLSSVDKAEFSTLGIDVKLEEESAVVQDYDGEVSSFDSQSILKEWDDFTSEDEDMNKRGKEYLKNNL